MIVEKIKAKIPSGAEIPKPDPKGRFLVKGWGRRRDEAALIYTIPNRQKPSKPYEKGITVSEFEAAYRQLRASGALTRQWFEESFPACAREGSCNFTTVGGVLELLGEASYVGQGTYQRTSGV